MVVLCSWMAPTYQQPKTGLSSSFQCASFLRQSRLANQFRRCLGANQSLDFLLGGKRDRAGKMRAFAHRSSIKTLVEGLEESHYSASAPSSVNVSTTIDPIAQIDVARWNRHVMWRCIAVVYSDNTLVTCVSSNHLRNEPLSDVILYTLQLMTEGLDLPRTDNEPLSNTATSGYESSR